MSQQWAQQSRSPGGGGSVRRARERMEAGLPPEVPQLPPQKSYDPSRPAPNPPGNRSRPQMPVGLATTRNGPGPIGVAISRPTQVPQWPLAATIEGPDPRSNQQYQPPPGRGAPPQRPPRPSHVPSMLDASRVQEHTPAFQYKPQQSSSERSMMYSDDDVTSPDAIYSPMTQSSRPSTISSVGTIPDFPVPIIGPPRRSANLGPPPSSRRGASSYYSQASFVSPIPEESPRTQPSHGSYASSAAIPSSWGSDYGDEEEGMESGFGHDIIEERGESRGSNVDDSEDRGLIRSASVGKRAKPSMITTRSSDRTEQVRPSPRPQQQSKLERMGVFDGNAGGNARVIEENPRETMWPMGEGMPPRAVLAPQRNQDQRGMVWPMAGDANSPLAGGTGLIDTSTSSSENTVPTLATAITTDDAVPPVSRPLDQSDARAQEKEMLGAYNAASSLQPGGVTPTRTPSPGAFSRLSAIRRPPRLDMDAVRDAEARGSLTSLPDLIRRATRLAAMMDRGKRPGSRLNDLNDFPMDGVGEKDAFSPMGDEKRKSGLSGMLAAFPPPGVATPREGTPVRPQSSWPSAGGYNGSQGTFDPPSKEDKQKKKRRCCGLPCWGFFIIIVILLIIIAAAVVVPLELLVFRKPKTSSSSSLSAVQQCEQNTSTACQNGGTSLIATGSCACVCTNGFTGATCTVAGATGCTTTTLAGSTLGNVTLGESIPRLISAAQTNFSIPLSDSIILARFNSASLSCSTENALVTFDGESQRKGNANDVVTPTTTASSSAASITSSPNRRNVEADPVSPRAASVTTGIVVDTSSVPTRTSTIYPSIVTSSATSSSTADPTAVFAVTEQVLDFARVAVLYVLQQETLDSAVAAQSALQKFFDPLSFTNRAAMNISLGNGNTINLVGFTLDVGNGTIGKNSSTKARRAIPRRSSNIWVTS
ncbi:hypothetical protein BGZ60DRAFT_523403 [Tricladium varicosporioides]|nr:hypothetical protein BGZ60DRAFT_523403 [Hymenoscyphus varicosporioides]